MIDSPSNFHIRIVLSTGLDAKRYSFGSGENETLHTITAPLSDPVKKYLPPTETAVAVNRLSELEFVSIYPPSTSHVLIVPSEDPDARRVPSGAWESERILLVCPLNILERACRLVSMQLNVPNPFQIQSTYTA
ncbi:hypothetical protein PNOK_0425900 [Pyrrhoderma noxium]|uniref:Uncharacterized protein n=1 Tax=Pyrrhoderma noxium TaxID=2282107 RepID=A0A286UIM2_9AGAM|nr:hypothetical protein PNOK_0425900 [Pyrrhoderma noxium]